MGEYWSIDRKITNGWAQKVSQNKTISLQDIETLTMPISSRQDGGRDNIVEQ